MHDSRRPRGMAMTGMLLFVALSFVATAGGAKAAPSDSDFAWKWKKKLVGTGQSSAIAVDAQGRPHVIYAPYEDGSIAEIIHAWSDGSKWFREPIGSGLEFKFDLDLTMDAQGVLHVVYGRRLSLSTPFAPNYLWYANNAGGSWTVQLIEEGGENPSVAVDGDGVVHIVHVRRSALPGHHDDVRYVHGTAAGWQAETMATAADWLARTDVLIHESAVCASWSDANATMIHVATLDAGAWTIEDVDSGHDGSLAFDGDGILHLVYNRQFYGSPSYHDELRHAWRTVEGWQHETLVTVSSIFGLAVPDSLTASALQPALVSDFAGRLQLAFGFTITKGEAWGMDLMAATLEDGTWQPQAIGPNFAGFATSAAVSRGGIVHVVTEKALDHGQGLQATLAVELKGRRLSMSVVPPMAGSITDTLTGVKCTKKLVERLYPGTEVTLEAAAAPGFQFVGWAKCASGTGPTCTLTLSHDCKLVARFEPSR